MGEAWRPSEEFISEFFRLRRLEEERRHLFRNVYGFALDASRLADLAAKVPGIAARLREEIRRFLGAMQALYSLSHEENHPRWGFRL